ncbi:hypothetical protein FRB94_000581 [Tulasnella sp. JGI-2019a]|nr:hypothetical protein FRB94_000581 [Tulasnella sp. JGI-2019a]KAG9031295.1 hypothetical protein FRB95_002868 [Tulasnella sp. JGI-2019a]
MAVNSSGSSSLKSTPATTRANENKTVVDDHLIRGFKGVSENLAETRDAAQLIGVAHDYPEGVYMSFVLQLLAPPPHRIPPHSDPGAVDGRGLTSRYFIRKSSCDDF